MVLVPVVTACIAWQLLSSPEAFRAVVVVPTSAVLRAFRGAAAAVGEIGFWAILVVAFAASAIAALRASGPRRRDRSRLMPGSPSRDELTFWEARLSYVRRSLTARQSFAAELRRLVIAVLAFAEGTEAGEIEERVARGEVELPPSVAAIVAAVPLGKPPRRSFLARVFRPVVPGEEDEARAFLERTGDAVDYLDKLLGNGGGREN
jgi:hypothetical protein